LSRSISKLKGSNRRFYNNHWKARLAIKCRACFGGWGKLIGMKGVKKVEEKFDPSSMSKFYEKDSALIAGIRIS
jgi:hypothetical protein